MENGVEMAFEECCAAVRDLRCTVKPSEELSSESICIAVRRSRVKCVFDCTASDAAALRLFDVAALTL